ncbi:DUF1993 domain-containing protein [Frigidibacter sp. RF13]|uniref:DUF1993 domain-containing protein n=1 Tax=Frigidibacter sp. RF13 TaxID=2997340 RepID=UPI002270BCA0|nr:DUF1993 domain-containing protein [Frigidibacter sp. RF13]MCY1127044.1 DUF1993 domain-containing protein [Frigidibacter sp. RF13]
MSLYDNFAPPLAHGLTALSKILDKAEAHCAAKKIDPAALLAARLYPDMFPFTRQIQIACDQARRAISRLKGEEPASVADSETSFAELKARIASTVAQLNALTPADLAEAESRTVSFKAGPRELTFTGDDYIRQWILPNFYFHMTTAYALLRHNGVELGKADFLGG